MLIRFLGMFGICPKQAQKHPNYYELRDFGRFFWSIVFSTPIRDIKKSCCPSGDRIFQGLYQTKWFLSKIVGAWRGYKPFERLLPLA